MLYKQFFAFFLLPKKPQTQTENLFLCPKHFCTKMLLLNVAEIITCSQFYQYVDMQLLHAQIPKSTKG